jgi:hypothetical protein
MVVFPALTMVTVPPLTVATLVFELVYKTGKPELEVAFKAKGAALGL